MISRFLRSGALCVFLPVLLSAQVVFSRRVYSQASTTYPQIWMWNPADGSLEPLTHSPRNHFQPSCSADGHTIRFVAGSELSGFNGVWSFDRKTGVERKISATVPNSEAPAAKPPAPQCTQPAAWAGKTRFACASGQEILLFDDAGKKEIARVGFSVRPTAPRIVAWSPNRQWLLVGTEGQNDNSTSRQSDYFVLDVAHKAWIPAGSGNDAFWTPGGNQIVYSTPRDLVPLGKRHVWSAQLVSFDPATRKATPITSGVTYNINPAPCAATSKPERSTRTPPRREPVPAPRARR